MPADEKAIRVITFSGKHADWTVWEEKFLARSKNRGYTKILLGKEIPPKDDEEFDQNTPEGKEKSRLREANDAAFTDLILSVDGTTASGRVAFNLVRLSKTKDHADGDAGLAWRRLQNKYATKSAPSLLALKKEFTNSRLANRKDDPDIWIAHLEDLKVKMEQQGSNMGDVDFMIHLLNNLPKEYEVAQAKLEDRLNDDIDPLTIEEIRTELNLKFQRMNIKKPLADDEEEEETALFAGGFKGTCHGCGKIGHKKPDCPENAQNKNKKDKRNFKNNNKCAHCGKRGHKSEKCWVKYGRPENAAIGREESADIVLTAVDELAATFRSVRDGFAGKTETREIDHANTSGINNKNYLKASDHFSFLSKEVEFSANTWIGDSGASCHMTNDATGLFDCVEIDEKITIGNGRPMKATKIGRLRMEMVQRDGSKKHFTMQNVKFVPELYCKLFSVTTALDNGFQLGNKGRIIFLQKGDFQLAFNKVFETKTGFISGVELIPREAELAQAALEAGRAIDINDLHRRLGHPSEEVVRKVARDLELKLTGKFNQCENCAISKARRKNINKGLADRSGSKGERLFIDISSIQSESLGGKKFWLLAVDDFSDYCFSYFLKTKDELSGKMIELIRELKATKGIDVKVIRCDNAGENRQFERDSKKLGMGLNFEYTAPGTPQQNGRVERKFAALYGRVRAILNGALLPSQLRQKLWAEGAATATICENLFPRDGHGECSHKLFFGELPRYARHLRTFGEIAIVTDHTKIRSKLADRGKPCMFMGYSTTHTGDTYRFLNLQTFKCLMSRDVIWLNKNYGQWKGIKVINRRHVEDNESDDEDVMPDEIVSNPEDTVQEETEHQTPSARDVPRNVNPRINLSRELRNLQYITDGGNPTANEELARLTDSGTGREVANVMFPDSYVPNVMFPDSYAFLTHDILLATIANNKSSQDTEPEEPKNFQGAWNHNDPVQREKWRIAINKELGDMKNRNVWRVIKRKDMPHDRRCVKNKWVFKIKRNGVFRARLVACGYTQVPGVDFTESFAPVINDATWRIMLVAMLLWDLKGVLIDVECAFLEGQLEEEVYMNCPEGLYGADNVTECLRLDKSIYGLVQSARQWQRKFVKHLRDLGFVGGFADPCLFSKKSSDGIIFIALYVDDCLCIGDEVAIKNLIESLRKFDLKLKIDEELHDYLSCEIHFSPDRKAAILHQPHIIKSIEKEFEDEVKDLQNYKTPGTPGIGMVRDPDGVSVTAEEQSRFRMGVGKLLYLVKYTRPDIANAVRELSKMLDCTNAAAIKELRRVVKYVLDTRDEGLRLAPIQRGENNIFDLTVYCDSDFAGDKETRISVAGYVMYLCGAPISWRSKAMKHVTLSSSEAEYVSLSEAVKEIRFIVQVIESMGIDVKKPITVRVDNLGAIFMAKNVTTSTRTKHIDVRYRYITEFIEKGEIEVIFVRTEDNNSDGFTKNLIGELHEKHKKKMIAIVDNGEKNKSAQN